MRSTTSVRKVQRKTQHQAIGTAAAAALQERDAPILLVLSEKARPKTALWRASVFSERMGSRIVVLVCLPPEQQVNMLFPHRNVAQASKRLEQDHLAGLRVWRWCNKTLLRPLNSEDVLVRRGDLASSAATVAKKVNARLVILSEQDNVSGRDVTAIVEDAGVSVMLSRATRPANAVIAATDLTLQEFPVLRKGVEVAHVLGARLTVVHNVDAQAAVPLIATPDGVSFLPIVPFSTPQGKQQRSHKLETAVASIAADTDARLLEEVDTVDALLRLAKSQKADLVVVGHRRRSWLGRVFGDSVSNEVINRSLRSIMVVPVEK